MKGSYRETDPLNDSLSANRKIKLVIVLSCLVWIDRKNPRAEKYRDMCYRSL